MTNAGRLALTVWVEASAALTVVGVYGAWVTVDSASIPGTSAGNRGWVVLVAALVAAGVFWFRSWTRSAGAYVALSGVAAAAAVTYDRAHLAAALGGSTVVAAHVGAGWGLDLAFAGSVSLVIGGVAWLIMMTGLPWAWLEPRPDDRRPHTTAVDLAAHENEQLS